MVDLVLLCNQDNVVNEAAEDLLGKGFAVLQWTQVYNNDYGRAFRSMVRFSSKVFQSLLGQDHGHRIDEMGNNILIGDCCSCNWSVEGIVSSFVTC